MNKYRNSKRRPGYTLLEMLVLAAAMSVVLGLSVASLAALFRVDRAVREEAALDDGLSHLAVRFRDDARVAEGLRMADEGIVSVFLLLPGGDEIEYRANSKGVVRLRRSNGETIHRDLFRLPGATAEVDVEESGGRQLARWTISRELPATDREGAVRVRTLRVIEAAVGGPANSDSLGDGT